MLLQALDALAHRAVGDLHLLRGMREIQVPGSRFEEAKRLEPGKYARACGNDTCTNRWR
jgi:hypothetical protein